MTEEVMTKQERKGLSVPRIFTEAGVDPLDTIEYEKRDSKIVEPDGTVVFELKDMEVPKSWSQLATDIISSKYVRKAGVPLTGHETSARQVVYRLAHTIREAGELRGYFDSREDAESFEAELSYMLITQRGAFNSPVWFNVGLWHQYKIEGSGRNFFWDPQTGTVKKTKDAYSRPQCSACFIQALDDDLESIFNLVKTEAKLFKYGSGTGTNFSTLRGRQEKLSSGGKSSGLLSFLEVLDRAAGSLKSGGTTRRAAKMVCLDMDHPEILDFIQWKTKEEQKVKVLIDAGYSSDFNGEAYHTVAGQNANNSVRLSDKFMNAVISGGKWQTIMRTTGEVCETFEARDLMEEIGKSAWACADPGVQFDDTINDWHTCPNTAKINASNPCSEYMFIDDSACNLASLNLMKYLNEDGSFRIDEFKHACRVFFLAQEILVDFSSYPTESIAKNSYNYRPLGLGYANLGTLLMVNGVPYDSEEGYAIAGAITAIMCSNAYITSAEIAAVKGPFEGFERNRAPMLRVMNKHREASLKIDVKHCPKDILETARVDWDKAVEMGEEHGYRNAQATVLAPTGTIGLLMDCDTTGVEPEFSLVKWKKLAGGGYFKIINQSIPRALKLLGYDEEQVGDIVTYIMGRGTLTGAPHVNPEALLALGFSEEEISEAEAYVVENKAVDEWTPHVNTKSLLEKGLTKEHLKEVDVYVSGAQTVEGAPHVRDEHLAVFDCANRCGNGQRFIDPMAHIKMQAAVQPFLSGSISKTVNLPNDATVEDIKNIYIEAWKIGLKCVALYRDGCKLSQPLSSAKTESEESSASPNAAPAVASRKLLPKDRVGRVVETSVGGNKLTLRTSEFEDGSLAEVALDMHKEGASFRSLMNCFMKSVSIGLQHGVPLSKFVEEYTFTRFEPNGFTDHPNVKTSTSIPDFVFRVLGMQYNGRTDFVHVKPTVIEKPEPTKVEEVPKQEEPVVKSSSNQLSQHLGEMMGDAPPCNDCGNITVRNGSCYRCLSCGNSMGCS